MKNKRVETLIAVLLVVAPIVIILAITINKLNNYLEEYQQMDHDTNPFIVDLDFCSDVDDAVAVRITTTLDKMGKIDLKAMMLCTTGENNIEALNGLLTYDGYGQINIGTSAISLSEESPYWDTLAQYKSEQINTENSVKLYRQILNDCANPVTIVTTGYLTNIAELLKSGPDDISDKNGKELVNSKVKALYITGGAYPEGYDNNFYFRKEAIDAAIYVNNNCDIPVYYISSNNGAPFKCGGLLQAIDIERVDPLSQALDAFGTLDGRAAWDPLSIYVAASSLEESRVVAEKVNLEIDTETGFNKFITDIENGKHFRINRVDDNIIWYKTILDSLTVYDFDYDNAERGGN